MKASHALLGAFGLARKVRLSFEKAVELDGTDIEALSDLGEFYVGAPSIVGGGLDKAQMVADRLQPLSLEKAHRMRALIALKKGDKETAERKLKAAVAAGGTAEAYVDLGRFYAEHDRPDQAMTALQAALGARRMNDAFLVDFSSLLTSMRRSPDMAIRLLREYLASPRKTDEAPAFRVHVQLDGCLRSMETRQGRSANLRRRLLYLRAMRRQRKRCRVIELTMKRENTIP